jgi:uncharacterized membrane protein
VIERLLDALPWSVVLIWTSIGGAVVLGVLAPTSVVVVFVGVMVVLVVAKTARENDLATRAARAAALREVAREEIAERRRTHPEWGWPS